jgi:hypothetical protein
VEIPTPTVVLGARADLVSVELKVLWTRIPKRGNQLQRDEYTPKVFLVSTREQAYNHRKWKLMGDEGLRVEFSL